MSRSVPKSKRAAYVYDRDFIVVDDISGVLKMRSQCAVDGYGFLSANGDPRNPQEIPPDIRDDMAAWPDARPIGPAYFVPEPAYVYFIVQYDVVSVELFPGYGTTAFSAGPTVCFNAPLAGCDWYIDGVLADSGINVTLTMTGGVTHSIRMVVTDTQGHTGELTFSYDQPYIPHVPLVFTTPTKLFGDGAAILGAGDQELSILDSHVLTGFVGINTGENYTSGKWFIPLAITGNWNQLLLGFGDNISPLNFIGIQIVTGGNVSGVSIDAGITTSDAAGIFATGQQIILYADATNHTWGIITPDNVDHPMALSYPAAADQFLFYAAVDGFTSCVIDLLPNASVTLTPPAGYSNAVEP